MREPHAASVRKVAVRRSFVCVPDGMRVTLLDHVGALATIVRKPGALVR